MTKMELIMANREKYHKAFTAYVALPEGLEKDVTMSLTLPWIKNKLAGRPVRQDRKPGNRKADPYGI